MSLECTKLCYVGFGRISVRQHVNFLGWNSQYINFLGWNSQLFLVTSVVLQSGHLFSLLSLLYFNDVTKIIKSSKCSLMIWRFIAWSNRSVAVWLCSSTYQWFMSEVSIIPWLMRIWCYSFAQSKIIQCVTVNASIQPLYVGIVHKYVLFWKAKLWINV